MRTLICGRGPLEGISLLGRRPAAPVLAAGASYASWGLPVHDSELGQLSNTGKSDDATLVDQDSRIPLVLGGPQAATAADASLGDLDAADFGETLRAAAGLTASSMPWRRVSVPGQGPTRRPTFNRSHVS